MNGLQQTSSGFQMRGLILCLSLGNDFTLFWLMKVNQKNWEGVSFSVDLFSWIKNAFLVLTPLQVLSALSPKPHILEYCFLSHSTTKETKMNLEASQCWK